MPTQDVGHGPERRTGVAALGKAADHDGERVQTVDERHGDGAPELAVGELVDAGGRYPAGQARRLQPLPEVESRGDVAGDLPAAALEMDRGNDDPEEECREQRPGLAHGRHRHGGTGQRRPVTLLQ